jgi:hypothetical protein
LSWSLITADAGTNGEKVADQAIALSPTVQCNEGDIVVVNGAFDNISIADGDTDDFSINDTDGNTWIKLKEHTRARGAAADAVTVVSWITKVAVGKAIGTGDSITVFAGAVFEAKGVGISRFAVAAGKTFEIQQALGAHNDGSTSNAPSVALSGMPSQEYLLVAPLAVEHESLTLTEDPDYSALHAAGSGTAGATTTNVQLWGRYRIATLTGDTYAPTLSAVADWAVALIALKEIDEAGAGETFELNTAGSVSPSATVQKGAAINRDGNVAPVGSIDTKTSKTLAGVTSSSGVLTKEARVAYEGASSPSGLLLKQSNKMVAGIISPSGSLDTLKAVTLTLAGSISPSGLLLRRVSGAFEGSSNPAGALRREVQLDFDGQIGPSGTQQRKVEATFEGQIGPSGAVETIKAALLAIGGAISPSGSLVKRTAMSAEGLTSPAGILGKGIQSTFEGQITPTAQARKLVSKGFAGQSSPSGVLGTIKAVVLAIGGSITPSGTLSKQPNKVVGGQTSPSGAITHREVSKQLQGEISPQASLLKVIAKTFAGLIAPSGMFTPQLPGAPEPLVYETRISSYTYTAILYDTKQSVIEDDTVIGIS